MPLKVVRRPGTDMLYVRGTVRGTRVFESTGTAQPGRAEAYRAKREAELWDRSVYGARAVVTFDAAVRSYLETHPPTPRTAKYVDKLLLHFTGKHLSRIDQEALDEAYKALLTERAGPATKLRAVLTPLRAIMEHAARRKWCDRPSFEKPEIQRTAAHYLRPAQATALVQSAAPHLRPLLVFLLCTGCRLGEALALDWQSVDLRGKRVVVWQKQGSAGHDNAERHIDLPPRAVAALSALGHRAGHVFRPPVRAVKGKMVQPKRYRDDGESGGQIRRAWATAARGAGLPGAWRETEKHKWWAPAITPHDLRHTWATWHYCVHRDLQRLRDDGGWGQVSMVERYAKRMPDAYRKEIMAWWHATTECVQSASASAKSA